MKHSIMILTLAILAIPACKKEKKEEPKPVDKTTEKQRYLMGKNWRIDKVISEGQDVTDMLPACFMDNVVFHFNDSKTGYTDEGQQKCDAADSQRINFSWTLIANESKLVIDDKESKDTLDLLKVSASEMELGIDGDTMKLKY